MSEQSSKVKSPIREDLQKAVPRPMDQNMLYRFPLPLPLAIQGAHQRLLGPNYPIGPPPFAIPYMGPYLKKETIRKGKWTVFEYMHTTSPFLFKK